MASPPCSVKSASIRDSPSKGLLNALVSRRRAVPGFTIAGVLTLVTVTCVVGPIVAERSAQQMKVEPEPGAAAANSAAPSAT
jgi:hypothetical protein